MLRCRYSFIIISAALAVTLVLVYCGGSPEEPVDPLVGASLCLSEDTCAVCPEGDSSTLIGVTNCGNSAVLNWTASETSAWFGLLSETGTTPGSISVIADTNRSSSVRSGLIVVTADGLSNSPETLWVTQPLVGSFLCVSPDAWTADATRDISAAFSVTNGGNSSSLSWEISCDSIWVSAHPSSGGTPGEFTLTADSNHTGAERTAIVTVASASVIGDGEVTVTQPPMGPTLCVSPPHWEAPSLGGESEAISVVNCGDQSAFDWEVTEDELWLTLSTGGGSTPGSFIITADTNHSNLPRTGYVHVTAPSIQDGEWTMTVDQPALISLEASYPENEFLAAIGVFVSSDYAHVACMGGLRIIDISVPSNPVLTGSYVIQEIASSVFVFGNYAYVTEEFRGLEIIDITNRSNPVMVGSYDSPHDAQGVYVSGGYAYLADGISGLLVIDVSNSSNPVPVTSYDVLEYATGVFVSGDYAYVADRSDELAVIDISTPSSPFLAASPSLPNGGRSVFVYEEHAYVTGLCGLQIINVSEPSSAFLVGGCDTPASGLGVYVSDHFAYVATVGGALYMFDVSDVSDPVQVGSYESSRTCSGVSVDGNHAYVTTMGDGLLILKLGL
ncbi:MAG: hypothetical protein JSU74_03225 [Candidatus Zixiibacteriota bacterium]|nr:MAG: hypothetical protein JSU74_03225 [candidate division Zixibacteria bacterium]